MADKPPVPVKVGRGAELAWPIFILGLCLVPVASFMEDRSPPIDALRWFILAQCVLVFALYAFAFFDSLRILLREKRSDVPPVAFALRMGRLARLFGTMVLATMAFLFVYSRLGEPELVGTTPAFQLLLLLKLVAWYFSERTAIIIERRATQSQLGRIADDLKKLEQR